MYKRFLILIFLSIILLFFGCEPSSKQKEIKQPFLDESIKKDSVKKFMLSLLDSNRTNDQNEIFILKKIKNYKNQGDIWALSYSYSAMAKSKFTSKEFPNALLYSDSAYTFFLKNKDTVEAIRKKAITGNEFSNQENFVIAYSQLNKSLELARATGSNEEIVYALTPLSILLSQINDYEVAHPLFIELINRTKKTKHPDANFRNYINYACLFGDQNILDSAKHYYDEAIKIAIKKDIPSAKHMCLTGIAQIHLDKKEYDEAIKNALAAEAIYGSENIKFISGLFILYDTYFESNNKQKTYYYLQKILSHSKKLRSPVNLLGCYKRLEKYYSAEKKDYKTAYYYLKKIDSINKDLNIEETRLKIKNQKIQDTIEKQKSKINLFKKDKIITENYFKKNRIIIVSIFCLLLFIVGSLYYSYLQKSKRQLAIKEKIIAEGKLQLLLSKMNPHFLYNSLNSIQNRVLKSKKEEAYSIINDFSQLLRTILKNSESSFIPFSEEMEFIELYLSFENMRLQNSFEVYFHKDPILIEKNPKIPNMILQPYIENAILHGFSNPEQLDRKLELEFKDNSTQIWCRIKDNGVGRAQTMKKKKNGVESKNLSMATNNTQKRLEFLAELGYNDAKIEIKDLLDNKGTEVIIIFPYI